jgi:NAD(P)-dependent dehydrogenase (short-subunit alcohol dehydrogenase family)
VNQVSALIEAMCAAVPAGRDSLDEAEIALLRPLTLALLTEMPESKDEYQRFLSVLARSLPIPVSAASSWLRDKTVLVTGGTGCVGSALIVRLLALGAGRVVSVSRGVTEGWPRLDGAEYRTADVRDRPVLAAVMAGARPDVLFHVAAQRDPGLAEHTVHHTVTTNVIGTHNVVAAAARAGVPQIVLASARKTDIPYTRDIYTTSKRIAEWLAANAAGRGNVLCSAARFAPVADNSIAHRRILDGCDRGVIRVRLPDQACYVQSAAESAQLLIRAGLEPQPGVLDVHAVSDLGRPFELLPLALGALSLSESAAVICFSGRGPGDPGGARIPRQYDPGASRPPLSDAALEERFRVLETACAQTREPDVIRRELDALSRSIFEKTLSPRPGD